MSNKQKYGWKVECLWLFCRSLAIMPHWYQYYVVAEFIYFVLRYVVRYRRRLVLRQLAESFPEKSEQERRQICDKYYKSLACIFVDIITLAGMSDKEKARRIKVTMPEELLDEARGRNIVVLCSHYGCWEYLMIAAQHFVDHHVIGAYHPLKSKVWNDLFIKLRTCDHLTPVASSSFMRFYLDHRDGIKGKSLLLGLIADQNSPANKDNRWYDFLNHPTYFFEGGESVALKYNLPVYYADLDCTSRGHYHFSFFKIYDGEEQVAPHTITERYVKALEKTICRRPELWMWSHRRWKYAPDPVTGKPTYIGGR